MMTDSPQILNARVDEYMLITLKALFSNLINFHSVCHLLRSGVAALFGPESGTTSRYKVDVLFFSFSTVFIPSPLLLFLTFLLFCKIILSQEQPPGNKLMSFSSRLYVIHSLSFAFFFYIFVVLQNNFESGTNSRYCPFYVYPFSFAFLSHFYVLRKYLESGITSF